MALHQHSETQSEYSLELVNLLKNHCNSFPTLVEWIEHVFDPAHPRKCDALLGIRNTFGLTEQQVGKCPFDFEILSIKV